LQVGGRDLDLEAAPAAADVDRGVLERGLVEDGGQRLALAERADATGDVAGRALGSLDVGHLRLLALDGLGEELEVELLLHRHDRGVQLAVDLGDEGLEDRPRVELEALDGFEPVGLVLGIVLVGVELRRDPGALERLRGGRLAQAATIARRLA
jgi:hypothetical protein